MDKRGQALLEYAILLTVFTAVAAQGWHYFFPAINQLYERIAADRAGIRGMRP